MTGSIETRSRIRDRALIEAHAGIGDPHWYMDQHRGRIHIDLQAVDSGIHHNLYKAEFYRMANNGTVVVKHR